MKKKLIAIVAVLFMTVGTAFSQVIITDEDFNHNRANTNPDFGVMVPMQNVNMDQWKQAPLGSGLFLLAGLGAAYLLRKRKED